MPVLATAGLLEGFGLGRLGFRLTMSNMVVTWMNIDSRVWIEVRVGQQARWSTDSTRVARDYPWQLPLEGRKGSSALEDGKVVSWMPERPYSIIDLPANHARTGSLAW